MLDKKYKKTLEILNGEIELNHNLFLEYLNLAEVIKDEKLKIWHLNKANEYIKSFKTLSELKEKLCKEIES
jgi:hypothetical protein